MHANEFFKSGDLLDVSATFNNCFFHCYILYCLSRHLPLPEDLFTFRSLLGRYSPASQLQTIFTSEESLSLFLSNAVPASSSVFEKTLILGVLLREWCATQLLNNIELKKRMFGGESGVCQAFLQYREFKSVMTANELFASEQGLLYEANKDFLEYFCLSSRNRLSLKTSKFNPYFNVNESEEKALEAYWLEEGYALYCRRFATLFVKLTPGEVSAILMGLGQPFIIYNYEGSLLAKSRNENDSPVFGLILNSAEGHYYLSQENNQPTLSDYEKTYQQYKKDRIVFLEQPDYVGNSLLIGAICPQEVLGRNPFHAMIEKIRQIQATTKSGSKINFNFLLKAGVVFAGTAFTSLIMVSIATMTEQYDPGESYREEGLAISSIAACATATYSFCHFFKSPSLRQTNTETYPGMRVKDY
ncbi:Dot/Icm T4SS effector Ceg23 [Legionella fairfieldensis]|uniref:Dot/Icm T4SS effector Ceg23 n=1 Tax=Legionella fairfieldensis TaxID=45064 RepID=UPI0006846274|nr:hypothetical protein [Legionella fairfieldensis]